MKTTYWLFLAYAMIVAASSGCSRPTEKPKDQSATPAKADDEAAAIAANLAKLGPEDRKLADEQVFCAVQAKSPLGSMGVPFKVTIGGQPVLLCCDGCETRAKAHVDRTLAKALELREATAKRSETK